MLDVKLVVVGGANEGDEFHLELPATLGRGRETSLPLPHPLVSRQHCELVDRDGSLFVRDLGSTNGTFVGSERVTESLLQHGQLLTIGTVTFRAFLGGAPYRNGFVDDEEPTERPDPAGLANNTHRETASLAEVDTSQAPTLAHPRELRSRAK